MVEPRLLILDPYHGGSHAAVTETLLKFSPLPSQSWTLPARHWKWRMGSAHLTFSKRLNQCETLPSHLLTTDMLDLSRLQGLCPRLYATHCTLLMHENQLSYPRPERDREDLHLGMININSCLAADRIWWNSEYHRDDFLSHVENLSRMLPEQGLSGVGREILERSQVLGLPLDLDEIRPHRHVQRKPGPLKIAWNHRRDQDKGAVEVLHLLADLIEEGLDFEVMLFGERFRNEPSGLAEGLERLGARVIHDAFISDRTDYLRLLAQGDVLLSTSKQENFGLSVAEAVQLGLWPLLPNALCYPELIPESQHEHCLYSSSQELKSLILQAADQPERQPGSWYERYEAKALLASVFPITDASSHS